MARRAFKSALFVIRDYVHSFHSQELFQKETGRALFDSGPIPNSLLRRYFKTSAEQSSSEAQSLSLGRELDAETHDQEYMRWSDGGGMFHRSSRIDPTARIEIGAVVHSDAVVEENVCIGSGTVVGPGVIIGQSTKTGYMVSLANCLIGDFCHIHNGVCIGQDGFGFFVDEEGHMVKKPQNLLVHIGNHVEIGANTCIDRGSWRDTVVGDYTKIDNLVQIGHNVVIGKNCMFCGQAGIAGSVTIGDYVILGGKAGIRDHVCIASNVRLAANSCGTKNINEPGDYAGFPAVPIKEWRKQIVATRNVTEEYWKINSKGVSEESTSVYNEHEMLLN